ncbi:roadblock/LC7 domain-containing protein [Streptomyces sp. NBC_01498]|uniref:roadblock/LC7 domain-containing protein n=1 Tax=Streptomyces sp. NBC_01498 TaxID=2975870 RepID=UPI002E7AC183|nr:roadblock/LC7 domain-containing protein [Streptomyces sp. NBC_01498]WTL26514.1 roadblock/LC7 domain-containing protein [Streptomyces sp. NBC_01498]
MTAEAEVLGELRRLRARMPQLTGALAATTDGLVLAEELSAPGSLAGSGPGSPAGRGAVVEPEGVAALTAAVLGVSLRLTDATGQGGFRELLIRGEHGYVATYAAGGSAVLTVLAEPRINVGRLHLEARRSGARIGVLVDGALERRENA